MKKNMSVILAVFAAAAVVFVGVRSFACDKVTKTANNYGTATYATKAGFRWLQYPKVIRFGNDGDRKAVLR